MLNLKAKVAENDDLLRSSSKVRSLTNAPKSKALAFFCAFSLKEELGILTAKSLKDEDKKKKLLIIVRNWGFALFHMYH